MLRRLLCVFLGFSLFINLELSAQLYINEVMPSNDVTVADAAGEYDDWLEIYNAGNLAIDLSGYYISDNILNPLKYQIPNTDPGATTVSSGGYLVLWADMDTLQGANHLNFKLNSSGESLFLTAPDGVSLVDSLTFPSLSNDVSYSRIPDGFLMWQIVNAATPAATNNFSMPLLAKPEILPLSGSYSTAVSITISAEPGSSIYYTTDGTEPTINSSIYSGPFSHSTNGGIRAIAVKSGFQSSLVETESYIFNSSHTLPIINIAIDPDHLWSDMDGMLVVGTNGTIPELCGAYPANFWQDWEFPANVILLNEDGTVSFDEDGGLSVFGNCTRRYAQKSVAFKTKSIYPSPSIPAQVFPTSSQNEFRRLRFRSGGNHWKTTMMGDAVFQSLPENKLDLDLQSARPAVAYYNGQYMGITNMRHSYSKHYFRYNHKKLENEDFDIVRMKRSHTQYESTEGDSVALHALYQYFDSNPVFGAAEYAFAEDNIDLNSFINYYIAQMWIQPADWPSSYSPSNKIYWKPQSSDGKWRMAVLDTDGGWADETHDTFTFLNVPGAPADRNSPLSTVIFRRLMSVPDFKNEYVQRAFTQFGLIYQKDTVKNRIDSHKALIDSEMPSHIGLWGPQGGVPTYALWDAYVDDLKVFADTRNDNLRNHISSYYNESIIELQFNFDSSSNGHITVNSNFFQIPYNYNGQYVANIPVRINAIPNPGYKFSHWLETGNTDPELEGAYSSNTSLTPVFVPAQDLVINEIHYNPLGSSEAEEFVEIYNPDNSAKNIGGYTFSNGICFTFPKGSIIGPDEYIIIANDGSFYSGNAYQVFEYSSSSLSNGGEDIVLINPVDQVIDSLTFDDAIPWPLEADGVEFSLALTDHTLDNSQASSWDIQLVDKTTPGAVNFFCPNVSISQNVSQPLCANVNDGQASVNLSVGNAGYLFSWSHGPIGPSVSNLSAGNYIVTAMDTYGCMLVDTIDIYAPTVLLQATLSKNDESILGAGDGSINLTTSVVNAVSYLWSNGATTEDISGLNAGTYSVDITDANGCITTQSITLNPGPQLPIAAATFTPNNGVAPINISFNAGGSADPDGTIVGYAWNFGDGSTGTGLNPTHNYSIPGLYVVTLTVTDSQGLTDSFVLSVNVIDTCDSPTNITLITSSANSLIVNWTGDSNAISYNLRFRDANIGGSWTNYPTTGTTAIITGLNACTDYEVKVSNQCTFNLQSGYSTTQIFSTTNCFQCTAPLGLYQFNIQNISAIITWDVLVGATSYTYKFRKVGDPNWISETTTFPIAVLFGISGCTDYEWTMETTCYDGSTAQSSTINNFSTQCKDEEALSEVIQNDDSVFIFPNPATNYIDVILTNLATERLLILDSSGKLIQDIKADDTKIRIQTSLYPEGLYFINDGFRNYKFIVKH